MKKIVALFSFSLVAFAGFAQNPVPFTTAANIDINNINARHMVHGDMWWNPATGTAACEFPKGSGKNVGFAAALWVGAYDTIGNLHVAAQTYRQNGNDYWPGPLDANGAINYSTEADWAKIWKVNKSTIDSFRVLITGGAGNVSGSQYDDIKTWPANGNADANGVSSGNPLSALNNNLIPGRTYAPFVDLNGNGIYEWAQGEYPAIKGDQMLWWVVNDNGSTHNESSGTPLKIEIHTSAYAYHRGGALDNIVFYEFKIFNRSQLQYDSVRIGLWSDVDLGDGFDDYIGYDSSRRMGVTYNGDGIDGVYGTSIPTSGIAIMESPYDTSAYREPAGSFTTYNNIQTGPLKNPATATEYNNLLRSSFTTGQPYANGKNYYDSLAEMCNAGAVPNDRRFIISTTSHQLHTGEYFKVGMAMIVCPNAGGCPNMDFTCLKAAADSASIVYHYPAYAPSAINDIGASQLLQLFPNPAQDKVFLQTYNGRATGTVKLYNVIGKEIAVAINKTGKEIELNIAVLPNGIYTITYSDKDGTQVAKFVKQ